MRIMPAVIGVPDAFAASAALALVAIPSFLRSPAPYLAGTAAHGSILRIGARMNSPPPRKHN
jgi:hypothetical protein